MNPALKRPPTPRSGTPSETRIRPPWQSELPHAPKIQIQTTFERKKEKMSTIGEAQQALISIYKKLYQGEDPIAEVESLMMDLGIEFNGQDPYIPVL